MSIDPFWTVMIITTASSLAADILPGLLSTPGGIVLHGWETEAPATFDRECFGIARAADATFSEAARDLQGNTSLDPGCIDERYLVTLPLDTGTPR
jgi:hypothetical protein